MDKLTKKILKLSCLILLVVFFLLSGAIREILKIPTIQIGVFDIFFIIFIILLFLNIILYWNELESYVLSIMCMEKSKNSWIIVLIFIILAILVFFLSARGD